MLHEEEVLRLHRIRQIPSLSNIKIHLYCISIITKMRVGRVEEENGA